MSISGWGTLVMAAVLAAGCAKEIVPMPSSASRSPASASGAAVSTSPAPTSSPGLDPATGSTDRSSGATAARPGEWRAVDGRPDPAQFKPFAELPDIYFEFDRYAVRPDDHRVLDSHASWLRARPRALLVIEGHCDERGTSEYNVALGERRAQAAADYLVSRGIDARRMTVISYGAQRPVCVERDEACWARNRRAHFLVKIDEPQAK
jgi:peptidoglycan-associated lipoprotein